MTLLDAQLRAILTDLQGVIALVAARLNVRERAHAEFLLRIWTRLSRTATRFERLYQRWRDGTLPRPRLRGPRQRATSPATPPARRLPAGKAWVLRAVRHHNANAAASRLQYLLGNAPELAAFLAAAPQAGRLLRPLCRMLGIGAPDVPAVVLTPPPRTAAPRVVPNEPSPQAIAPKLPGPLPSAPQPRIFAPA